MFILISLLKILIIIVPLLISVAYFTLAERKIMGAIQRRRGPNVVGVYGLLQPLSDGFKLLVKETVLPSNANKFIFILAPIITFVISLMGWAIIPYDKYSVLSEVNVGVLYLFAISSLGVYGIIMSGWASNSKYAFLGALRSAAQMVSYEVSIGFIIVTIVVCCGSFNLQTIIESQENDLDFNHNLEWSKVSPREAFTFELCAGICDKKKTEEKRKHGEMRRESARGKGRSVSDMRLDIRLQF
jgi:NADH-quinone oxidoreductase subunit H